MSGISEARISPQANTEAKALNSTPSVSQSDSRVSAAVREAFNQEAEGGAAAAAPSAGLSVHQFVEMTRVASEAIMCAMKENPLGEDLSAAVLSIVSLSDKETPVEKEIMKTFQELIGKEVRSLAKALDREIERLNKLRKEHSNNPCGIMSSDLIRQYTKFGSSKVLMYDMELLMNYMKLTEDISVSPNKEYYETFSAIQKLINDHETYAAQEINALWSRCQALSSDQSAGGAAAAATK
jgi:hypothetical protein